MINTDLASRAEEILGHRFQDPSILITSLTHSSVAGSRVESNERLEFLGDAILNMVTCDQLYGRFADWLEGELTKVKSVVVSRRICAAIADEIGLTKLLILGNGIDGNGSLPTSLRAAVLEAVIGALYLDGGLEAAKAFITRVIASHVDHCAKRENHDNHKSALQQYAQRYLSATPHYEALDEQGPDHSKCFEVCVVIQNERFPGAWGPTKKDAEQEAARRALDLLQTRRRANP